MIDAEFDEVENPVTWPEFIQHHDHEPPRRLWPFLLGVAVLIGVGATAIHGWQKPKQDFEECPSGWAELLDCSYAISFDGTKELNLYESHAAVLYDKSVKPNGKFLKIEGTWAFDETTKQYAVSVNGQTTAYSLIDPDSINACMLVKGSLDTVDLRSSWFSRIPQDADDASNDLSEMEAKAR